MSEPSAKITAGEDHDGDRPRGPRPDVDLVGRIGAARQAQAAWAAQPIGARLKVIREIRHRIAIQAETLAASVRLGQRTSVSETLAAEILPLADACRFLEREAGRALAPRRAPGRSRPVWLRTVMLEVRREPLGVVLIIAPGNYPLLLPGVQALQALAAGNAVLLKPAEGAREPALALAQLLESAGMDPRLVQVLPEPPQSAQAAIRAGVDKVVLTGSATTGQAVLAELAPRLTPATMELSGCDAVFVRADADVDLVVRALAFGMRLSGGATCIAPRRAFVHNALFDAVEQRLARAVAAMPPVAVAPNTADLVKALVAEAVQAGARLVAGDLVGRQKLTPLLVADATADMQLLKSDVFAPVLSLVRVAGDDEALAAADLCPYALGATVFGERRGAKRLAEKIDAGCVVVNDMIVPTADPRLPFGGRRRSGFGVTRGLEGLLEMTAVKAIAVRRGRWLPHLEPPQPDDARLMASYLRLVHGRGFTQRIASAAELLRAMLARPRKPHENKERNNRREVRR